MTRQSVYIGALAVFLVGMRLYYCSLSSSWAAADEKTYSKRNDRYEHREAPLDKLGQRNGTQSQPPMISSICASLTSNTS